MTRSIGLIVVILGILGAEAAWANMPPPARPKAHQMQVTLSEQGGPVRLRVPREMLAVNSVFPPRTSQLPTMIAGVALACAITLAGLKLVSRRRVPGSAVSVVLLGGLVFAGATALADISLKPVSRPSNPSVDLPVVVEITETGQTVQMTLNAEQAAQIAALVKPDAAHK